MTSLASKFAKRLIGFSLGSWVNLLISLVSTPITTALFLPGELGKINLFTSYANILIPFVYLGFDQAYVRFYNEPCGKNSKKSLFKLCLSISVVLLFIVSVFIVIFWKYFSSTIIGYETFLISFSLILYLGSIMLFRYINLKARMDNQVMLFFLQSVISTIIIKLSFISVAIISPISEYAIYFRTILLLIASIFLSISALRHCMADAIDNSKPTIIELSRYAIPLFPTVFLIMLNISLSQIILRKYVDYTELGIYSNAITVAGIITVAQSGLNIFWTPFVYEYYKDQVKIQRMHHIISFSLILVATAIILSQDLIYTILVNYRYWSSKKIMAILLISPVCETISETLGLGIELSKKTYLKLPIYFVSITVNVLSCVILVPRLGMYGAAVSNALASLSMLVIKSVIGERFYRCSDGYTRLIISFILLITLAFMNYYISGYIIKIIAVLTLLVVSFLYKDIIKLLFGYVTIILGNSKRRAGK